MANHDQTNLITNPSINKSNTKLCGYAPPTHKYQRFASETAKRSHHHQCPQAVAGKNTNVTVHSTVLVIVIEINSVVGNSPNSKHRIYHRCTRYQCNRHHKLQ